MESWEFPSTQKYTVYQKNLPGQTQEMGLLFHSLTLVKHILPAYQEVVFPFSLRIDDLEEKNLVKKLFGKSVFPPNENKIRLENN